MMESQLLMINSNKFMLHLQLAVFICIKVIQVNSVNIVSFQAKHCTLCSENQTEKWFGNPVLRSKHSEALRP